ncbi:unnamed protein product [Linum trigynum]|uniref:Reverse transcriptase Ty1/copia-type domain-containing protein n=1 Tax=Linum trigynum TaxID=586398 RepID=A0AAV2FUD5_9ROSI
MCDLLLDSRVPGRLWPEAAATTVCLINYQITPVLRHTCPYYALYSHHPDYSRLRIFGCLCFVLLPKRELTKLSSKTARYVFLGYSDVHKGYLCFDPVLQRMLMAATVVFFDHLMYFSHGYTSDTYPFSDQPLPVFDHIDGDIPTLPPDDPHTPPLHQDLPPNDPPSPVTASSSSRTDSTSRSSPSTASSHSSSSAASSHESSPSPSPEAPPPCRSNRTTQGIPPLHFQDYFAYDVESLIVPTRYKQAKGDPKWEQAMKRELAALHENNTWILVTRPPPSTSVVGCRWVYTIKMNPDGTVDRYKARLVAQGFTQELGVDYNEIFAPVVKMSTVRTLLAVAAQQNWPLFQMNAKNAFLHGDLDEDIYMELPPGYTLGAPGQVCKLQQSLYGLKQAPRAWFEKFQSSITGLRFLQSLNDPSLFTRTTSSGIVALLLYVDDMIITETDLVGIQRLKDGLHASFSLKDLCDLSYFLDLEVQRSSRAILLSQRKYLTDLLAEHHFAGCKPVSTPMEPNLSLGRDSGAQPVDDSSYHSIVGVSFTYPPLVLTYLTPFSWLVSSCPLFVLITLPQFIVFFATFMELVMLVCFFLHLVLLVYVHTLIPILLAVWILVALLLVGVSSMGVPLFLGGVRSKRRSLSHLLRPSTGPCMRLPLSSCGYVASCSILVWCVHFPWIFLLTIPVLSALLLILSCTIVLNILRSTCITFGVWFAMARSHYITFALRNKLLIC